MGRYGTALRLGTLILIAATLVAGIYGRRQDEGSAGTIAGLTGQRQKITFHVAEGGRPSAFSTQIFTQCPTDPERPSTWSPANDVPVPFVWHGRRLMVHETKTFDYGNGSIGTAGAPCGRPGSTGASRAACA